MFIMFVSMATELSDRQRFYENSANLKQIILLLQTKICIMYTHSGKSTSVQQKWNIENNAIV